MTYREDSEIQFLYGWLSEKSSKKQISGGWLNSHPTSPAVAAKIKTLGARKPVAWLVSNCKTKSHRELYVKKLQEHVPVDIFGGCGRALNCNKGRDECFVEIARSYQFYLSFENSLCKDYATEKLFRALASDLVPVVMGGANYSKIVPPKSIINVEDFPSPKVLGEELKRLVEVKISFYMKRCPDQNIQDESDYLDYFWWKEHYTVNNVIQAKEKAFCNLCEKLNEQKNWSRRLRPVASGGDLQGAGVLGEENIKYQDFNSWFQKNQCVQGSW